MMRAFRFKRIVVILGLITFMISISLLSFAETGKEMSKEERKKLIDQAKADLEGTTWEITLTQMGTTKKTQDKLKFYDGKIESELLTDDGFVPTSYTVSLKEEDTIVWETMQSSESSGLAFWRAEINAKGRMRGVLSHHLSDKNVKDYSFASDNVIGKKPAVEAIVQEAPSKAVEPSKDAEKVEEKKAVEVKAEEVKKEAKEEVRAVEKKADVQKPKAAAPVAEETKKKWWER